MNKTKSELYNELLITEINTKLNPAKYIPFENIKIFNENCNKYISKKCLNCIHHDTLIYKDNTLYCCSGEGLNIPTVGWHVIYWETIDICSEVKGYKRISDNR